MYKKISLSQVIFIFISINAHPQLNNIPIFLKGRYLGQQPPSNIPVLFAPGFISTEQNEVNSVLTPDGKTFYFSRFNLPKGYTIMVTKEEEQGWTTPQPAPFGSAYSEVDICLSYDGQKLFYVSKKPIQSDDPPFRGYQIWVIKRIQDQWTNAEHLGPVINFGDRHLYPTVTRDGTLYFNTDRNGFGKGDFFKSEDINGQYSVPVNLGNPINTIHDETDPLIAPDESFLIFTSVNRPDGFGSGDLYISFRQNDGSWGKVKNMGEAINTSSSEFSPMLSPDGQYLFFTSGRRGNTDIYWVHAGIIQSYK